MMLDKFKPTYKVFKLQHSLDALNENEIMAIIDSTQPKRVSRSHITMLSHAFILLMLMVICQGG